MDAAFLRKAFALIAMGLVEKEKKSTANPTRYPYVKELQHGINMFATASVWAGNDIEVLQHADEASFLSHFISKPIHEWFSGWSQNIIDELKLEEEAFYGYGLFAYRRGENIFTPNADCYEFLESQDGDIVDGTDERFVYEKMKMLDQETYCVIRKFIIENPIISIEERRALLIDLAGNALASEIIQFAYEEIVEDCYRCPSCGWTMTEGKYGFLCHSSHCTDTIPNLTDDMKLEISAGKLFRLKKGIMRYFAAPGKLELDIVAYCKKKKLRWKLWPQMDTFDVEIQFSDGEIWEIDAKAYRNPVALRSKIQKDNGFPKGEYARGYVVVPSEYTVGQCNYTSIVDRALVNQKNVRCVTLKKLKTLIKEKEESCHEE